MSCDRPRAAVCLRVQRGGPLQLTWSGRPLDVGIPGPPRHLWEAGALACRSPDLRGVRPPPPRLPRGGPPRKKKKVRDSVSRPLDREGRAEERREPGLEAKKKDPVIFSSFKCLSTYSVQRSLVWSGCVLVFEADRRPSTGRPRTGPSRTVNNKYHRHKRRCNTRYVFLDRRKHRASERDRR